MSKRGLRPSVSLGMSRGGSLLLLGREGRPMVGVVAFTVPVPPSLNNAYPTRDGRRRLSGEGAAYKQEVALRARVAAAAVEIDPAGWFGLSLLLYFRTRQRRDIDNCIKLVLDAVAASLGFDDQQIQRIVVERAGIDTRNPRCEVTLACWAADVGGP